MRSGLWRKKIEKFNQILQLALVVLKECECEIGCPSCIPPVPPEVEDETLESFMIKSNGSIVCTKSLIHHILSGKIIISEIKSVKSDIHHVEDLIKEDHDRMKLQRRLKKASSIKKKNGSLFIDKHLFFTF